MTYQIIARKFRPQNFAEVVGQDHVRTTLQNAISQGRVSQAYLFSGTRGVGKTTVARILAKALNCQKPCAGEPCLSCTSCQEIREGYSPDVIEIDGASNRGIDEIRDLRENIGYMPSGGKYKIYIIDEVHMLTTEAFNALLKTLEEPPLHVKFIFATTDPQKVPQTISSRCQNFTFTRIALTETIARLREIAQKENVSTTSQALELIAKHTDGSLRDAESIFDQLVSFSQGNIDESHVAALLGIPPLSLARSLAKSIYLADAEMAISRLNQMKAQGFPTLAILDGCWELLRELFLGHLDKKKAFPKEWEMTKGEFAKRTAGELEQMMELFFTWRPQVAKSDLADILLEFLVAKASQIEPAMAIEVALEKLDELEKRLAQSKENKSPVPETIAIKSTGVTASKSPKPVSLDAETSEWARFLKTLEKENPVLHAQLSAGIAPQMTENPIVVEFPENFALLPRLQESKTKETLIAYLERFRGKKTELVLMEKKGSKGNWKMETGREYLKDPIIQKTLRMLDGKIINVEEIKK